MSSITKTYCTDEWQHQVARVVTHAWDKSIAWLDCAGALSELGADEMLTARVADVLTASHTETSLLALWSDMLTEGSVYHWLACRRDPWLVRVLQELWVKSLTKESLAKLNLAWYAGRDIHVPDVTDAANPSLSRAEQRMLELITYRAYWLFKEMLLIASIGPCLRVLNTKARHVDALSRLYSELLGWHTATCLAEGVLSWKLSAVRPQVPVDRVESLFTEVPTAYGLLRYVPSAIQALERCVSDMPCDKQAAMQMVDTLNGSVSSSAPDTLAAEYVVMVVNQTRGEATLIAREMS